MPYLDHAFIFNLFIFRNSPPGRGRNLNPERRALAAGLCNNIVAIVTLQHCWTVAKQLYITLYARSRKPVPMATREGIPRVSTHGEDRGACQTQGHGTRASGFWHKHHDNHASNRTIRRRCKYVTYWYLISTILLKYVIIAMVFIVLYILSIHNN